MSSDDTDPGRGAEREAGRSEADADDDSGGQPRDPETGQFLPKDQREDTEDSDESDTGTAGAEPNGDDAATEREPPGRDSAPDHGSGSVSDPGSRRSGAGPRTEPRLRITRVAVGDDSGRPPDRSGASGASPLPPSLHLVPMQVQLTGERVDTGPATGVPVEHGGGAGRPRQP
ncbi:hypothetical protein [Halosimplex halophilum]|uniref:hypothetical protein n=1 Tax=Halosimplex halophilum TaxID=2559572 RepID=UPI00107F5092|nr:hypothetical protein [Halosimplex halophilum]